MASQRHMPESNIVPVECFPKARSNKYADPIAKARKSAYWRISVESSTDEGRNKTKTNIVHATDFSNSISAQRKVNQQKAMPARIEGMRNISSDVPSTRQACMTNMSNGGCEIARLTR